MNLYIIAGPNGVGKTTFARKFLPKYADCQSFINADLIAQGMSPFSPEAAAVRAGRLVLSEIEFFAQRRVAFALMGNPVEDERDSGLKANTIPL
jgi:predicted ABC-type ATPase